MKISVTRTETDGKTDSVMVDMAEVGVVEIITADPPSRGIWVNVDGTCALRITGAKITRINDLVTEKDLAEAGLTYA